MKTNEQVSLADYAGKYVVVYFYPLDFTFVCPTEIIAFSDRIQEFKEIDAEVGLTCSIKLQNRAHSNLHFFNLN